MLTGRPRVTKVFVYSTIVFIFLLLLLLLLLLVVFILFIYYVFFIFYFTGYTLSMTRSQVPCSEFYSSQAMLSAKASYNLKSMIVCLFVL